jgi:hypothetical protein
MAVINRYSNQAVAAYNPMSMQELAFAPTFLRQRHDQAAEALSQLDVQSGQYDVLNQYQPIANQLVDPLQKEIQALADRLATEGINKSQAIPQAMKLKSQYSNLFGQSGGIGQLQSATQQYRAQAEEIKKFFEKNPELARGAMAELQAGEAKLNDGKLELGQIGTPNYVRHYDAKEVNDILNSQIDNIKDTTLKSLGFSNVGNISSVQDIYRQGQIDGRSADEVTAILMSQLSPEVIQSAKQYGRYALGDEKIGVDLLKQQIQGAAVGRANQTLKESYNVITNEDRKNVMQSSGLDALQLPGARMETISETPFMNLKYENNRLVSGSKNSIGSTLTDVSGIDKFNYYNAQGQPVEASQAIKMTPSTGRAPAIVGVKEGYTKKPKGTDVPELESQFQKLKNSNPVLRNMTNEQALEHVQSYYKNIGQTFASQDSFKTNFDFVKNSLTGAMPVSTFINTKGQQLNLSQLAEENGMTEDEIVKSFTPTGVGVRPNIGTVVEGNIIDKNDKKINIFMEPDQRSKALGTTTNSVMTHIFNGGDTGEVMTPYIDPKTGEAVAGVRTYVVNDYTGDPVVIFTGATLSNEQLETMVKNKSVKQIQEMFEPGTARVQTTGELLNATTTGVRNRLQGTKF